MVRLIKAISIVPHLAKEGLINLSLFSKNIKRLSEKIASFAFFNCYKSSSACPVLSLVHTYAIMKYDKNCNKVLFSGFWSLRE
jgi:hypothetical protein